MGKALIVPSGKKGEGLSEGVCRKGSKPRAGHVRERIVAVSLSLHTPSIAMSCPGAILPDCSELAPARRDESLQRLWTGKS